MQVIFNRVFDVFIKLQISVILSQKHWFCPGICFWQLSLCLKRIEYSFVKRKIWELGLDLPKDFFKWQLSLQLFWWAVVAYEGFSIYLSMLSLISPSSHPLLLHWWGSHIWFQFHTLSYICWWSHLVQPQGSHVGQCWGSNSCPQADTLQLSCIPAFLAMARQ